MADAVLANPHDDGDDLPRKLNDALKRIEALEKKVGDMPTPSQLGYRIPIHSFEADKYFRFQLDRGHLTLMLNTDQTKRDQIGSAAPPGTGDPFFAGMCQIESSEATGIVDAQGNPVQWLYTITQVLADNKLPGSGNAAWPDAVGGFSGEARNLCENGNTGIGVQDNGVDHDGADYPSGFKMRPLQGTLPFMLFMNEDGDIEAWLDRCNSEDGLCSSE